VTYPKLGEENSLTGHPQSEQDGVYRWRLRTPPRAETPAPDRPSCSIAASPSHIKIELVKADDGPGRPAKSCHGPDGRKSPLAPRRKSSGSQADASIPFAFPPGGAPEKLRPYYYLAGKLKKPPHTPASALNQSSDQILQIYQTDL